MLSEGSIDGGGKTTLKSKDAFNSELYLYTVAPKTFFNCFWGHFCFRLYGRARFSGARNEASACL